MLFPLFKIKALKAQPNCEAYKYYGDTLKYKACKKAEDIKNHYQFSKEYQEILDESLKIDPTFDFAYREKSVAYLKSGDFITWKQLIDKAVEYNPKGHLGARAWCRFSWFRDYKGAIKDIEQLGNLVGINNIGYSTNGIYHLSVVKALCYSALGDKEQAIEIIENLLNDKSYNINPYDYFHLGVLYYDVDKIYNAITTLLKQEKNQDFAENKYYLTLPY